MFVVATFNVKDLFLPEPGEALSALWAAKLENVASRVRRSAAHVVALQEVGGPAALDALVAALGAPWVGACGAPNERGIANAMVSKLPFRTLRRHRAASLPFPTFATDEPAPFGTQLSLGREIVEGGFVTEVGPVHVLCIHLKSNVPQDARSSAGVPLPAPSGRSRGESQIRSFVMRAAEALFVRGLVDAATPATPNVVVAGDCNDYPHSVVLRVMQGSPNDPSHQELTSVRDVVPQHKRYTVLFRDKPQTLDHLLVSPALAARLRSADVDLEGLRDHGPFDPNAPPTVDSDHALLLARFD